jgi:hypothetical protein
MDGQDPPLWANCHIFSQSIASAAHPLFHTYNTDCTLGTMVASGVVHVGKVSSNFPACWELTTVCFHGFADLPHERGGSATSSQYFKCLGHEWFLSLELYPGGEIAKNEEEEDAVQDISLKLYYNGIGSVNVEFDFDIKGFTDSKVSFMNHCFHSGSTGCGYEQFHTRKSALAHLVKGSLVIEVWMRLQHPTAFIPTNPSSKPNSFLASIFMDEKSADVVFKIGGETETVTSGDEPPMKMQKTSVITLSAHRCVLMKMAPALAEFCKASPGTNMSPTIVELPNDSVQAFEALLQYIYGFEIFDIGNDIGQIKDILELANKYDVINLKLKAEDLLISSITLDVDNVIDYYLYAHGMDCALLKETVMDFVVNNWDDFHTSNNISEVPDGLKWSFVNDMMTAMKIKSCNDPEALDTMRISELRRKAYEKKLDVDGSREALISLLK